MDSAAHVLDRAGRLAVNDVERPHAMKPVELGVRLAQPNGVVLMPGSINEDVPDALRVLLAFTVGMPGSDDVNFVTGTHEALREVTRVILHAPDAVLWHDEGDDADPH